MSLLKRLVCLFGLLAGVLCPLCAQDWTPEDSLRLRRLLEGDGEIKLNPRALKELEQSFGQPKASEEKSWLRFDETLPGLPTEKQKKARLVLRPYTGYTPYNWDPIRQCKIDIDKPTWQENILRGLDMMCWWAFPNLLGKISWLFSPRSSGTGISRSGGQPRWRR